MKCDSELLWTLVEQSIEPGEESDAIAAHIETCVTCQKTLQDFGGPEITWRDAETFLPHDDAQVAKHESPWPPIDLSFLDQPIHPEMLGRIGRYDVETVLGRGGMGVVFRAHDSDLHRSVAVKVLAPHWAASPTARQRFAREAQAAASVAHENVIPIYNVESDATLPYLVMRYIPGLTLQRWVKTNGPPSVAAILRIANQLASGLAAAHRRGLIHRDIKPANVMVGENTDRVWITDFGLARAADSVTLTQTGVIAGTPHYMSPEQARGEPIDQRSDVFSLGCVFYFLCTGLPPLDAENTLAVLHRITSEDACSLTDVRNDLPPSFVALVHQMLNRTTSSRPKDCDEILRKLSVAQDEYTSGKRATRPVRRKHKLWLGAAMAVAAITSIVCQSMFAPKATSFRTGFSPAIPTNVTPQNEQRSPSAMRENEYSLDPSVAKAIQQIEASTSIESQRFREQVDRLSNEIDRLHHSMDQLVVPKLLLDDRAWERAVNEIEQDIRDAQVSH